MNKIKKIAKNFAEACRRTYLWTTNPSRCVVEKAKKEGWSSIEIYLNPSRLTYNGALAAYYVVARDPNDDNRRGQEIYGEPCPKKFKKRIDGREIVIEDEGGLELIARINAWLYVHDHVIPEANKLAVPINPTHEIVHQLIKSYNKTVDKTYLA